MITVELRLPVFSAIAFLGWWVAAPPAAASIYLAAKSYNATSVQVPAGLLGGVLLLGCMSIVLAGAFPRRFWTNGLLVGSTTAVGVVGTYWLGARLRLDMAQVGEHIRSGSLESKLEIVLLVFWVVTVMLLTGMTSYSIIASWQELANLAAANNTPDTMGPGNGHALYPDAGIVKEQYSPAMSSTGAGLRSDLKGSASTPNLHSPASHQFSWTESAPSLHIDSDIVRPLKAQGSLGSLVSLKRKNKAKHQHNKSAPIIPVPSMSGLDGIPEGFSDMDWDLPAGSASDNIRWILAHAAQSRNGSGSTTNSGSVNLAADYNRRINSSGFQKDEPAPAKSKLRHQMNLSQYEQERVRHSMV